MNPDTASLDNLRDIVTPPPVPWWPPAPGWWVLFGVAAIASVVVGFRAWQAWRVNAYRRAAMRELQSATNIAAIAEILKRTALVAYSRADVAAVSGSAWCDWLGQTAGLPVPANVADALTRGVFGNAESVDIAEVVSFAIDWIRRHAAPTKGRKGLRRHKERDEP